MQHQLELAEVERLAEPDDAVVETFDDHAAAPVPAPWRCWLALPQAVLCLRQGAQRALKIDEGIAVAAAGGHDPADEETMRADDVVMMQHTFQRADRRCEQRHVEHALLPGCRREPFDAFGAAGETQ